MNAGREEAARSNCFHDNRYRLWKRKPGKKKKKNFKPRASAFLFFPFSSSVFSQNLQKISYPWTTLFLPSLLYFFYFYFSDTGSLFSALLGTSLCLKLPLTSLLVSLFQLSRFYFFPKKTQSPFSALPSCPSKLVFPL